ncbi:hypothetical protein WDW37_00385 [Bdellovibrionota bacterium FG-1]
MTLSLGPDNPEKDFQNVIERYNERWRHAEGLPEGTLLRLAILREICRLLHAEKSRYLAVGRKDATQSLRKWENRLYDLRCAFKLEDTLLNLIFSTEPVRKRTRLLPEALFSFIERAKLERFDRHWENAIAAEAVAQGWSFWALETWVEITLAEEWDKKLGEQLWPSGLVLFAESSPLSPSGGATDSLWKGRWITVIHPHFKTPTEIALNLEQWPGTPSEPPSPPIWKFLFSGRMR